MHPLIPQQTEDLLDTPTLHGNFSNPQIHKLQLVQNPFNSLCSKLKNQDFFQEH
jgi:hypothetical protein